MWFFAAAFVYGYHTLASSAFECELIPESVKAFGWTGAASLSPLLTLPASPTEQLRGSLALFAEGC
jgi:hypothetical protein